MVPPVYFRLLLPVCRIPVINIPYTGRTGSPQYIGAVGYAETICEINTIGNGIKKDLEIRIAADKGLFQVCNQSISINLVGNILPETDVLAVCDNKVGNIREIGPVEKSDRRNVCPQNISGIKHHEISGTECENISRYCTSCVRAGRTAGT
jgi:hypothetical protein